MSSGTDENLDRTIPKRPSSILRIDKSVPRRSSGSSVDFRCDDSDEKKAASISPKVTSPQYSVTWAFPYGNDKPTEANRRAKPKPAFTFQSLTDKYWGKSSPNDNDNPNVKKHDTTDYNLSQQYPKHNQDRDPAIGMEPTSPLELPSAQLESDDEDYSVSVSAIMQRRASTRKSKRKGHKGQRRRSSSPVAGMLGLNGATVDRRRSSVYTTSSGDTAISLEDTNQESTQEQIFENIRLHKEVLQSVKIQPLSMRRKLKLVQQAKSYVARHEGALQERFATSRSTKDLLTRFQILLATKWQYLCRELVNLSSFLIPWELRIKEIESHFGSVVASYFTFLRWLFWVNIVMCVVLIVFVMVPEVLAGFDPSDDRKVMLDDERNISKNFMTIWEFEGFMKYSPLFYGYYSTKSVKWGYKLPMAYFMTGLVVYVYSFVATLRKMAENSRMSKLSSKDDECTFSWKIFTGWDFMIGHAETAHNRVSSIVLGFKEALLEEAEKKKDKRNWKVITLRIFVNLVVTFLLCVSAYAVVIVVGRSIETNPKHSWWRKNETAIVTTLISIVFPMFFEAFGMLEYYHPRQQLRLQLARIMLLNLLNLYSLIFANFHKIDLMTRELINIKDTYDTSAPTVNYPHEVFTATPETAVYGFQSLLSAALVSSGEAFQQILAEHLGLGGTTDDTTATWQNCKKVPVNCSRPTDSGVLNATLISLFLFNLTTTMSPDFDWSTTNWTIDDFYGDNFTSIAPNFTELLMNVTTEYPLSTSTLDFNEDNDDYDYETYKQDYFEPEAEEKSRIFKRDAAGNSTGDPSNIYEYMSRLYASANYENSTSDWNLTSDWNSTTVEPTLSTLSWNDTFTDVENSTSDYRTTFEEYLMEKWTEFLETTEQPELCYITVCENVTDSPMDETTEAGLAESTTLYTTEMPTTPIDGEAEEPITTELSVPEVIYLYNCSLPPTEPPTTVATVLPKPAMNRTTKRRLRDLCWETMFGQDIMKITVMDLVVTVGSTLLLDFFRALFVRFMNTCWCWDMEKKFPGYGDFKIAENILHLVNNQGMIWMGMFFSPGLAVVNLIKMVILMYLRSWTVLTCNVPHEVVFRASRSNNFYLALLLTMLFLCVLPVAYAIVWLEPSWHCGPFSDNKRIFHLFTNTIHNNLPTYLLQPIAYIVSPAAIIPLLVLLILIIYYLISLTNSLRESNQDLRDQLRKERTEERRKMWKIAEAQPTDQAPISSRWKMALNPALTQTDGTVTPAAPEDAKKTQARSELLARIMKKALRKSSATSDDESLTNPATGGGGGDDGTDSESHEPLPHDKERKAKEPKPKKKAATSSIAKVKGPWSQIIQLAKDKDGDPEAAKQVVDKTNGHPNKLFQVKKTDVNEKQKALDLEKKENEESDEKERVVSERRRSLLLRQSQVPEKQLQPIKSDDAETDNLIPQEADEVKAGATESPIEKKVRKKGHHRDKSVNLPEDRSTYKSFQNDSDECFEKPTDDTEKIEPVPVKKEATKGVKKLNNFFATVREAVRAKKSEQLKGEVEAKPSSSDPNADQVTVPVVEVHKTSAESTKEPLPQRQDSSSSIQNIPVIKISKTESDENILEVDKKPSGGVKKGD